MNRLVRAIPFLLLTGLLAMGGAPADQCCDEHVECESRQHTDHPHPMASCGDCGCECDCMPLTSEAIHALALSPSKPTLSTKILLCGLPLVHGMGGTTDSVIHADRTRARSATMRTSATVLAQRTVVLRT